MDYQKPEAILNFFRQLQEQKEDYLYEAKMLIVGEGGAGKTTLVHKIEDPHYQLRDDQESTRGIDVTRWSFQEEGKEFRVNIWDFGGQEIYYDTHQFFLTKQSLYILVADNRREDTNFSYWLSLIELLSGNSPVLILKNEKQDRQCDLNERQLRGQFINLKEILTANFATDRGLYESLNEIKFHIKKLPHIGEKLPRNWLEVRKALEADPRNHISLDEYLKICQDNGITQREDKLQLSSHLHNLGVCLHFQDDPVLKHIVILKPTWSTKAVYKLLDNVGVKSKLGEFTKADLNNIWHEEKYSAMQDELLQLMMKFKLCYEIPDCPGTYIAPQLLGANQPEYEWDESDNLILCYQYEFMPKGILTRFIIEMHRSIDQRTLPWKSGVILTLDQEGHAKAEIIEYHGYHQKEIKIRVTGKRKKDLLMAIIYEFDKIHNSYENLKYKKLVPCNCRICKNNPTPYFYEFEWLRKCLDHKQYKIPCHTSFEVVDVRGLLDDIGLPGERNQVFISYSHDDSEWLVELKKHLKPIIRNQLLDVWDDTKIRPGAEWQREIENALAVAQVAVLMVSPDFLASDFINNHELPSLLEAAERKGLTIIWIPLRTCAFEETEIRKYQAAYSPNQPLNSLNEADQDQAWVEICKKIKVAANL